MPRFYYYFSLFSGKNSCLFFAYLVLKNTFVRGIFTLYTGDKREGANSGQLSGANISDISANT
jgi:hypothetical protein